VNMYATKIHRLTKDFRREASLVILAQKFVQILLNSEHGVVSLNQAGDIIHCQSRNIRRLYDVASVLRSLNLVSPQFPLLFISCKEIYVSDSKNRVLWNV
jgi:hypothetical protein